MLLIRVLLRLNRKVVLLWGMFFFGGVGNCVIGCVMVVFVCGEEV